MSRIYVVAGMVVLHLFHHLVNGFRGWCWNSEMSKELLSAIVHRNPSQSSLDQIRALLWSELTHDVGSDDNWCGEIISDIIYSQANFGIPMITTTRLSDPGS